MKNKLLLLLLCRLMLSSCEQNQIYVVDAIQSLTLSLATLTVEVGRDGIVNIIPVGFSSEAKAVSADATIATAWVTGTTLIVKGEKAGHTEITVTTPNGKASATVAIVVL